VLNAALSCHPSTPTDVVRSIAVGVSRSSSDVLVLTFTLAGDLARLRIPPPSTPRAADRPWEHTCCEAFVAAEHGAAYHELNFSPSGEWAGYAFRSYRDRIGPTADAVLPPLVVHRAAEGRLALTARVALTHLSAPYAGAVLRLGLSAVLETGRGERSYWALRHVPGKPDFHRRDAWALRLEAARRE
jgi:hypothetical protein